MYALDDETRNGVMRGNIIIAIREQQCCRVYLHTLLSATVVGSNVASCMGGFREAYL